MIASFLLLGLQAGDAVPLTPLARQALPAQGCAAYLWSAGPTPRLVAMATADPATLRIALDGAVADYPRTAQAGSAGYGFAGNTTYAAASVTATLDLSVAEQTGLTAGATVPAATLTIDRAGKDSVVVPVAGLIGCAS